MRKYKIWQKWTQTFKNFSLKKKLLLFYSVLFLLPLILITVTIYVEVSQSVMEKVEYSATQGYDQAKSYLEYKIQQLIQRTDVVVTNTDLRRRIMPETISEQDLHQQLAQRDAIRSYLQSVESGTQSIRIKIYIDNELGMLLDEDFIFPLSQVDEAQWYQHKGSMKVYFAPGIYLEEGRQKKYIALVRDIPDENDYRSRNSVLRMDIDIEEIEEILRKATPTENAVTYLVNRENITVTASDSEKLAALGLGDELPPEFIYSIYASESGLTQKTLDNKDVLCMSSKIRNTDWEMITVIPREDMTSGILQLQYVVAGLMILFGLLTIVGGTFIISWIVRRISRLNDSFKQVQEGDTRVNLPNEAKDEIGVLYDNYNEMMEYTNALLDEKYKMGLHLKNAELKALQSQINPHFLYNTLDMVNWLAYSGRTEEIHTAVISLSKYYRLILNKGQDTLTLGEELLHVRYYIKIQEIRFPDKLEYIEEVEESILDSIVPKIILQPLVENAIQHGIWEKKEKSGRILIRGYEQAGKAYVQILDDGIGMDEHTLAHVMDGSLRTTGSSYGVKNVHARLQMMFGEEYGLSYQSREGEGTCVTLCFPK